MSNLEDQVTPVEDKEQERWWWGDGPNWKRFRIITEEEEYKRPLPQDMASCANNNSEKYISEKDVKEAILIKTPRPENLDLVKKLDDYLHEFL